MEDLKDFNVLTRRGGEDAAMLATRMRLDTEKKTAALERFRVLTNPQSLSVERTELDLSPNVIALELHRDRPTYCGVRASQGRFWELVFESKELCRDFARKVEGQFCLDGEFHAVEENATGFEVVTDDDPNATVLIVGSSVFLKSSLSTSEGVWQDLTHFDWTRGEYEQILYGVDDNGTQFRLVFQARSARERFLAQLPVQADPRSLNIFSGTWNVGQSGPPTSRELSRSWLSLASTGELSRFDVYVFGLQECSKKDDWVKALAGAVAFHLDVDLEVITKVAVVTMREVVLVVFTRPGLSPLVLGQDVRPTGIANTIGNKGAVGVGLDFGEFGTLAVVCAHLSAFQDNVKRRAQDQKMILKHLNLRSLMQEQYQTMITGGEVDDFDSVEMFDRVLFVGDLNYRVDMGFSGTSEEFEKVELLARGGRWSELVQYDQLLNEMRKEKVFFSFQEVKPLGSFPPTYRMNKDQQGYSNKRDQNPSFTDRILIRGEMVGLVYGANHELLVRPDRTLTISDHRPVFATISWKEEGYSWNDTVSFLGADQRDVILRINHITFRPSALSNLERAMGSSFLGVADENARFGELEQPLEGKSNTPTKRRLSGFTSSSRFLLRRNSSTGYGQLPEEEEPQLIEEDLVGLQLTIDENIEFRFLADWSTDYPQTCNMQGTNGFIRSFATVKKMLASPVRVAVVSDPRTLVGYARFRLPETLSFDQEVFVECPVGSRGARVGDLCMRLQFAWD